MPLYSIDREEKNGFPKEAEAFIKKLSSSDLLIVSLAEHNSSYTVAFKNTLDWCSRLNIDFMKGKKMLLMSTSPGKRGGANVLSAAKSFLPFIGVEIVETFSLPKFYENFNAEKGIVDDDLKAEFLNKIDLVQKSVG